MSAPSPEYKKFILFQWNSYNAAGGLRDITDSFDTLRQAQDYVAQDCADYNQVVDRDTWEVVWEKV